MEESKRKLNALKADRAKRDKRPSQQLPGYSHLIEYCCSPESSLGKVAEEFAHKITVIRVTKDDNAFDPKTHKRLLDYIKGNPGTSIHGSIPCTPWSAWQRRNIHALGDEFKRNLDKQRQESRVLFSRFIAIADLVMTLGGHVSFEWPRHCAGWMLPELQSFIRRWDLYAVKVDGCAAGMISSDGYPIRKPWLFVTSNSQQALALQAFKCTHHPREHVEAAGKETKRTEIYPPALATAMLESLFPHSGRIPAIHASRHCRATIYPRKHKPQALCPHLSCGVKSSR